MTTTLNAATLPLQGRHLIEASAGTGKTFTVANLYLRLLIDEQHGTPPTVENILVVTFTNAATEELRARLRSRIAVALQVLEGELSNTDDDTLHDVLNPHCHNVMTKSRLELAYQCMDQAAIFTIHGFCDRVLREQAFESGELFDAELQADVEALKLRSAEAWWRDNVTPLTATETETIPRGWRSPSGFLSRLASVITDPAGQLVPQFTEDEVRQSQKDSLAAWQVFCPAWAADGKDWVEQILAGVQSKLINKSGGKYTAETVTQASHFATLLAQQDSAPLDLQEGLSILGNTVLQTSTRKNKEPLQSLLGDCIDLLVSSYSRLRLQKLVALQCQAQKDISSNLAQRKLLARQRTFDDLLLQLHGVLHGVSGERLTNVLRSKYPVALIDEFQDTDRVQYEIFDKLFPINKDSTAALYLIGDPKQSIYRFRGADINIYLRARDSATDRHSLDRNFRSSARLLSALNSLYAQSDRPFGSTDIEYYPVTAGGKAEDRALIVEGETLAPLQFDCIDVAEDKLPSIRASINALAQNCAQRVAWMLTEANATLGQTPINAQDIAILVWTHAHAQTVRQALLEVGVVSAMQSRESVFESPEALDLLAFLRALARPGDSASLSRVLVSPLAGYGAQELLQQRDDVVAWQRIENAVEQCREQCSQAGPQAALLRFMSLFNTRVKALATATASVRGIDRILGNYLHLSEVLQTAWQEQPDLPALLKTVQQWREQNADESLQLRLESDEALVQIVTVHKSKGLQYPVVMLPFACVGKGSTFKEDAVVFSENGLPRLDIGSEHQAQRRADAVEALADEALRTLYVALTRAEQSCWIGVAANKNTMHATLWQLLGLSFPPRPTPGDLERPIHEALDKLIDNCPDVAKSETLLTQYRLTPKSIQADALLARKATRTVQASWRVGSYSALARGATYAAELPDHDAIDVPVAKPDTVDYNSPFHFPRGAEAGTLIHAVFEHLDFRSTTDQELQGYAQQQLRAHGVDKAWTPALCQLVSNTLNTPLTDNGFTLGALDKTDRLDELGFHFPVRTLDAPKLVSVLREFGVFGAEDGLIFDRLDGYMTGFIDLTFRHQGRWYVADYKSNHLGYSTADYHQDALHEAMQHHRYDLQYLIYSVALLRYLRARLPDFDYARDFGGVYYLFVRGMSGTPDAEHQTGVYNARPAEELLVALDKLLCGEQLLSRNNGNA